MTSTPKNIGEKSMANRKSEQTSSQIKQREPDMVPDPPVGAKDPEDMQDRIRALAYQLWLERGAPIGSPEIDWLKAEARLDGAQAKAQGAS